MDRFVTVTPKWKTFNYSSMAAQSFTQNKYKTKNDAGVEKRRKPLNPAQITDVISIHYNFDEHMPPTQSVNADHLNGNSNDSGLSSASSLSPPHVDSGNNKNLFMEKRNHLDNTGGKENATYTTMTRSPKSHKKVAGSGLQGEKTFQGNKNFNPDVNDTPEKPLLKTNNMILARIQRDFNSPSAAARVKAIRAMKSPTKSAYCQFDITQTEQSFHIPDPPSLEEIMSNIVVYVEVRSGEDNRSAGVRKVIEALGARVSLSLNRETTHVIFKDGLLSTYKKAMQLNIPIVSILWIEACKTQRRICDPKDYPISNLDRYENPELYTKMKRIKSMQPDSECNKRVRNKAGGIPKDSTPTQKTGNLKKTSTFNGGTPTSSTNKKKTDISQFFKKLEKSTTSSASKIDGVTNGTAAIMESPATKLLNRMHSECYTPLNESKTKTIIPGNINNTRNSNENDAEIETAVKKSLDFPHSNNAESNINIVVGIKATIEASSLPKSNGRTRRHSLIQDCEIETATCCMNTMAISVSTPSKPRRSRRSSIYTSKDMSLALATSSKINNIESIMEEDRATEKEQEEEKPPKSVNGRRTLYEVKTMDETDLMKKLETPSKTSANRRRTLYNSKAMETTEIKEATTKVHSNRRRTCFNLNSLEESDSNSGNTTIKERQGHTKTIDLTNDLEMTTTPTTAKAEKLSNQRRTLYEPKTIGETNITTFTPNVTAGSSLSLTPSNFQMAKLASSTLLEDNNNINKLVATPPANATNGKLLEETGQCATPLIFSSTRQPGVKRRTLFDVSMDIITQRLQCINQSARRSLAPPTPSAEILNIPDDKSMGTPITNNLMNATTPKSSTESLNECNDNSDSISLNTPKNVTQKRRRKLFMPNELLDTPKPATSAVSANTASKTCDETDKLITNRSAITNGNSATKRRRTLMPISQPQPTTNVTHKESISNTITTTPTVRKRRSTLDFEQTRCINSAKDSATAASVTNNSNSQQKFKGKKTPVLVCTNMHEKQIDVIHEAIDKLRLFVLESYITDSTTHVVSLEPRRTLNLLRALARGLWILKYSWITDSLEAGKWLPEELYELQDFSKAIQICRSERQAFGNKYKCDLFRNSGTFYISSNCYPISKENMRELITLCGGHVVNVRQKARYIIGDANGTLEDKMYLTPYWVLDSITQMQLIKFSKYMYPLPSEEKPASQPL